MLAINPIARAKCDEKLALVGVGFVFIRHGNLASVVKLYSTVDFIFKWSSPYTRSAGAETSRIATLDHEIFHNCIE